MAWSALGNFNPAAAIVPAILDAAAALVKALPNVPYGDVTRIYMHESCEPMDSKNAHYNIVIAESADHYSMNIVTDPRFNARSTWDPNQYAAHTLSRNGGAIGIALNGLDGSAVNPYDLGADPPTIMGTTWLCAAVGAVAAKYEIDISGLSLTTDSYYGELNTISHSEAGDLCGVPKMYDAYGPLSTCERWDWAILERLLPGMKITAEMVAAVGNALRLMAHNYKLALM